MPNTPPHIPPLHVNAELAIGATARKVVHVLTPTSSMRHNNRAAPSSSASTHHSGSNVSWPALVISETLERYVRAKAAVESIGFSAVWLPAILAPGNNRSTGARAAWALVSRGCQRNGEDGLRLAHRNAWQIVANAQTPMAIFEDDVMPSTHDPLEVQSYMQDTPDYDVTYLSEGPGMIFMTTAALWITPRAAQWLLHNTSRCLVRRGRAFGVDHNVASGCTDRRLRCRHALRLNRSALGGGVGDRVRRQTRWFGVGLFAQDRVGVQPLLHDWRNGRNQLLAPPGRALQAHSGP